MQCMARTEKDNNKKSSNAVMHIAQHGNKMLTTEIHSQFSIVRVGLFVFYVDVFVLFLCLACVVIFCLCASVVHSLHFIFCTNIWPSEITSLHQQYNIKVIPIFVWTFVVLLFLCSTTNIIKKNKKTGNSMEKNVFQINSNTVYVHVTQKARDWHRNRGIPASVCNTHHIVVGHLWL